MSVCSLSQVALLHAVADLSFILFGICVALAAGCAPRLDDHTSSMAPLRFAICRVVRFPNLVCDALFASSG